MPDLHALAHLAPGTSDGNFLFVANGVCGRSRLNEPSR